jgi:hypothetical protein
VKYDSLEYTNKGCSDTFHYAQNEATFDVIYDAALYTLLQNATVDILVNIKKDGVDDFTGRIFPTKAKKYNGILNNTIISLSAEDSMQKLDVPIGDVVYFGYSICNPASPTTSILHQLCYRAGFVPAKITSGVTIATTIAAFAPESENDSVLDVLDTLLFEYGYVLHFNESDVLTPTTWITSASVSTNFTEANMIQEVEVEDSVKDYYGLTTTYYEIGQIETTSGYYANIKLYQDSNCTFDSNGNFAGYEIPPGYLYPPACNAIDTTTSGSSIVYQEYDDTSSKYWTNYAIINSLDYNYKAFDSDFSSIIATSGCYIDAIYSTGITIETAHFYNKKARIVLKNPTASYLKLWYLDIRGYVWYRTAARIAEVNNTTVSGQKLDSYISTFLHTQAAASTFTTYLAKQYDIGAAFYTVLSDEFADVGTICNVTMNDGTNQDCLIMSRKWNEAVGYYTYKVRAQDKNVGTLTRQSITVKPNFIATETVTSELTQSTLAVLPIAYGGSPDFSRAYTDLYIYQGERNMSKSWAYSITTSGITGSFGTGDQLNRYTVSGLSGTSGSGVITATKLGFADVVVPFTVSLGAVEQPTLSLSTQSISRSRNNIMTPSGLMLMGRLSSGGAYSGRFKVGYSVDGVNYSDAYTSSVDETTHSYTVPATVTISGANSYVTNVKAQLYAMGGFTDLCDEKICGINADASNTPLYWGALDAVPSGFIAVNDYYFNTSTTISGGGELYYYTGSAWAIPTSAWAWYGEAWQTAYIDAGAWATVQGSVIAAASAIFNKLVTADAFIANLFAQQITVPDGGRIRYYNGQGVQKRCVQLADDRVDWIDTPNDVVADELLRGRIGRLGVGPAVLMDGDFEANIESPWSAESVLVGAACDSPNVLYLADGTKRLVYIPATGFIMQKIDTGGGYGSATTIVAEGCQHPTQIQLQDGSIRLSYKTLDGRIYERIDTGGGYGSATTIVAEGCQHPTQIQLQDGSIRLSYKTLDGRIYERIDTGGGYGSATVVSPTAASRPNYVQCTDNSIRLAYTRVSDTYICMCVDSGLGYSSESVISDSSGAYPHQFVNYLGEVVLTYCNASGYISQQVDNGGGYSTSTTLVANASRYPTQIQYVNDTIALTYRKDSDNYVYTRINSGSGFGAETVIVSAASDFPVQSQGFDGNITITYGRASDSYLCQRTLRRYAQVGAGIIAEGGDDTVGHWTVWGNGRMEIDMAITTAVVPVNTWAWPCPAFPKDFSEIHSVLVSGLATSTWAGNPIITGGINVGGAPLHQANLALYAGSSAGQSFRVNIHAVGKVDMTTL